MGSAQETPVKEEMMKKEAAEMKIDESGNGMMMVRAKDNATAYIHNHTLGQSLQLIKDHVWFGSVVGTYPPSIKRDASSGITTRPDPPEDPRGSKVAVVYAGSNILDGPNNCAWLLAWHAPAIGTTPCKVYVEAGDINKYSADIDWDEVESNLDASSDKSFYMDDYTKSEASANIVQTYVTKADAVFDIA